MVGSSLGKQPSSALRWPLLLAGCVVLLAMVALSTARETYQEWKVDEEMHGLRTQVEAMEGKKLHLTQFIQQLQAPDALDKEARMRFGLRKPGERLIVLRGGDGKDPARVEAEGTASSTIRASSSNPQKWLSYFFVGPH